VSVDDRVFTVDVDAPLLWEGRLVEECSAVAKKTRGVRGIRVHIRASGIHGLGWQRTSYITVNGDRQKGLKEEAAMRILKTRTEQPEPESKRSEKRSRSASPHDLVQDLEKVTGTGAPDQLAWAAQVETVLRAIYPCEVVKIDDGVVTVDVEAPLLQEARLVELYNSAAKDIEGVKEVRVHILPSSVWGLG
jgi:hypothetical protein